ncbi:MAG: YHS domain-containing protein, partial [Nevskia sp.]|nr:YHS domain-containing protein [Nevskia sp.]
MSTPVKYRPQSATPACCQGGAHTHPPAGGARDPVCGMTVDPARALSLEHAGTVRYFCSTACRERFAADPDRYLAPSPAAAATAHDSRIYTCPMHPEVRHVGPGSCPKCGMALEPEAPALEEGPDPELLAMRRRLYGSAALTAPLLLAAMSEMLPGGGLSAWLGMQTLAWGEALLATPVVWWLGGFVFARAWQSLRLRSPNMWTLIALGSGAAWGYSALALLVPAALPA